MKEETKKAIEAILNKCIAGAVKRTSKKKSYRPFHTALLTEKLVNASAFERSFSTSFGQGPVEEISAMIALEAGYEVERQKVTLVNAFKGAMDEIERNLSALRGGERKPNCEKDAHN